MQKFVPAHGPVSEKAVEQLLDILSGVERLIVLTGAGISTESGIPDYRSPKIGAYERHNYKPVMWQDFSKKHHVRQRFWARNFLAWPRFRDAQPNSIHKNLAIWERSDRFHWLLTQNVDGLHSKAGSEWVTELHGCGHRVVCPSCSNALSREEFQERLAELNPRWVGQSTPGEIRPDGDIQIADGAEKEFNLLDCEECGNFMKTDVVFFGENVHPKVMAKANQMMDESDGLLVLGSSLQVMTGYRFAYTAKARQIPFVIVNIGPTRADPICDLKIEAKCSDIVSRI
ncbi:unnamed protein product, partial [Mesorhabditis spiculigera]